MIVFFAAPAFLTVLFLVAGFVALVYNRTGVGGLLCGAGLLIALFAAERVNSVLLLVAAFCAVILIGDMRLEEKENRIIASGRGIFPSEWNSNMGINEVYAFIDGQVGWHTRLKETAKTMVVLVTPIVVIQVALAAATESWHFTVSLVFVFAWIAFALFYFFVLPRRRFYPDLQKASEEMARLASPDAALHTASVLTAKMFDYAYNAASNHLNRPYQMRNSECFGCMRAGYLLSLRERPDLRCGFPPYDPDVRRKILHEAEKTLYEKECVHNSRQIALGKISNNADPHGFNKTEAENLSARLSELNVRQLELARALCIQDAAYADAMMKNLPKWIVKRETEYDRIRMIRQGRLVFRSGERQIIFDGQNFLHNPKWDNVASLRASLDREIKNDEAERAAQHFQQTN